MIKNGGLINWFARNAVAANLIMILVFLAGALSLSNVSKEMFPRSDTNMITVRASYPGAAPVEVEKGVILPIESALEGLQGIKKIWSNASRDFALITLETEPNQNVNEIMSLTEGRIDGIVNFPSDMERPQIQRVLKNFWAVGLSVHGNMTQQEKKILGEEIYDELLQLPEIKELQLWGAGKHEISIEVDEARLRAFSLTLQEVADAVRASSLDLPAGIIRTDNGNVQLRTEGKSYFGEDFEKIVIRGANDGSELTIADVADVKDGFMEENTDNRFDRASSFTLGIFSLEGQNLLKISEQVQLYAEEKRKTLPNGLKMSVHNDEAYHLNGRLQMMSENLFLGSILVAIVLALFLNLKIAMWVMVGIPLSFAGAFWLMPLGGVTVNVMSLFAFIMVLGIVVDDAIIIGESVYREITDDYKKKKAEGELHLNQYTASIETVVSGTHRVAIPSTIGLLTTMAAFLPLMFLGGTFDGISRTISIVVLLCLTFSLIESKLILPSHLVGLRLDKESGSLLSPLYSCQQWVSNTLYRFIDGVYEPILRSALNHRYVTLASFLGTLILIVSVITSGIAKFEFFPNVPGDDVRAEITMHDGASRESISETINIVENAIYTVNENYLLNNPSSVGLIEHVSFHVKDDSEIVFRLALTKSEFREITANDVERLWRDEVGLLPDVRKQRYMASEGPAGPKISLSLSGPDPDELSLAGIELQEYLTQFQGVYDIYNSQGSGNKELLITLKPSASQVGVRLVDIARQVRQAFHGEEAQRIQRDSETINVMVRFPYADRRSIASLENMLIRTSNGESIAIGEVANIQMGLGVTEISRLDRKRTITITAEVLENKIESGDVVRDVKASFVPMLLEKHPSVEFRLTGGTKEQNDYYSKMIISGLTSLVLMYGLLAVPLKSYLQPVLIMSVIPFGFVGAAMGHMLLGVTMNMLSIIGIMALAGVVVNDSLIMVDFANRQRADGLTPNNSIIAAGKKRFRAILLTTLTTFVGLLPLLFETSVQAQFVIPMALSLSFGIVFASTITLILVPCLYVFSETNRLFLSTFLSVLLAIAISYFMTFIGLISPEIMEIMIMTAVLLLAFLVLAKAFNRFPERDLA
mgnify:FL=1|tara:strand:- start:1798 stop:5097 length:3300 start_codon:yes stop_codon:yes gene_type:complete